MELMSLTALSPLDGRYSSKCADLRPIMSEYGLIHNRVRVEVQWLITLSQDRQIKEIKPLDKKDLTFLNTLVDNFSLEDAENIKTIERTTNHDVKAIEYFLQQKLTQHEHLQDYIPFIHFGCTSEDINNLAYSLMLKNARSTVMAPMMQNLIGKLRKIAQQNAKVAMLARTHGQPASPTTLGKEMINFCMRLQHQLNAFVQLPISGKFNGAVGNFNAHHIAYPNINWPKLSNAFVESLGLQWNQYSTQIEPHDNLAELLQILSRFNTVLIDLNRDIWGYISVNYFSQKKIEGEVGSSTMPHKVNPIDFENSEGNLGLANGIITHLANKLPISRWQRDLTDSTVLRNLGIILGYSLLAYQSTLKGLNKLIANPDKIAADLNTHWEVLAEAVQTVMRRYGDADAYEHLKKLTRGQTIDANMITNFIDELDIPDDAKKRLQALTPNLYTGYAEKFCDEEGV